MAEIIETTGKTVEDALAAALEKLGCGREEVTYEVIQEPSGGFLGLDGAFRFDREGVVERAMEVREVRGGSVAVVDPAPARF